MNAIQTPNFGDITKSITESMTDKGMPWLDSSGLMAMQKKNMTMLAQTAESFMAGATEMMEKQADAAKSGFELMTSDLDATGRIDSPQAFAQMQVEAATKAFEFGFGAFQEMTATALKLQATMMDNMVAGIGEMSEAATTPVSDAPKTSSTKKA